MGRDFEARLAEIENVVLKMGERGDEWLEENIRLLNVRELFREEKVRRRFEREVVADTEGLIDGRVTSSWTGWSSATTGSGAPSWSTSSGGARRGTTRR
jgi:hypothetical protein